MTKRKKELALPLRHVKCSKRKSGIDRKSVV